MRLFSHSLMKKILAALLVLGIATTSMADIQAPPKSKYTSTRKLARGLANVLYGWTEIPTGMWRAAERGEPMTEVWFNGIISGLDRTGARLSYGLYEIVNFRRPIYKGSFRAPYTRYEYDHFNGYHEFPPQLDTISTLDHTRTVSY